MTLRNQRLSFLKQPISKKLVRCVGVVIFLLMILTAFIGYVPPWDQITFRIATMFGTKGLIRLLLKVGCPFFIALPLSYGIRVFINGLDSFPLPIKMMIPSGSGTSGWTTYLFDSASRSGSDSINQGDEPPPPPPEGEGAANPGNGNNPSSVDHMVGGDSIQSIKTRLLSRRSSPSDMDIKLAEYNAKDLFELKEKIIIRMGELHPRGNWMGRGARALDNPHTSTGEPKLEDLARKWEDLQSGGRNSQTFYDLSRKVFLMRTDLDAHSAT